MKPILHREPSIPMCKQSDVIAFNKIFNGMELAILILTSWVISDRILILYNKQMNSDWHMWSKECCLPELAAV